MNILIINPIIYTSENKNIKRIKSIKDTMIYDLSLAFHNLGHSVVLYAGEPFKPLEKEDYPFEIIWGKCIFKGLFMPHCLPFIPEIYKYIKNNRNKIDLIICSEVFSINTFISVILANEKTIIWHELAKHNKIMKKIPSLFWYNVVARLYMNKTKVIARSFEAKNFIKKYCKNTQEKIIDHGVNLSKFELKKEKNNYFVVCSQLIERKKIDGIIHSFYKFLINYDKEYMLYIIGDGDKRQELENLVFELGIGDRVIFKGKMTHKEMLPYLSSAKALLVNTKKDNNMISIIESISVGTPILTTDVPLNSRYIREHNLGIVEKIWNEHSLYDIVKNNEFYVDNCEMYRERLSTLTKANVFLEEV